MKKYIKLYALIIIFGISICNKYYVRSFAYGYSDGSLTFNFLQMSEWWGADSGAGSIYWSPYNNNDRCIVFVNDEFSRYCSELYSNQTDVYSDFYFVIARGGEQNVGGRIQYMNVLSALESSWFLEKIGMEHNEFMCYACVLDHDIVGGYNGTGSILNTFNNVQYNGNTTENVQYVTTFEDLKKYLVDGDNSVVHEGDPLNPPVTQDNTLPVPQSLTCDLHNSYNASNPFIEGSWKNPNNASWDAIKNEVKIHIQYKPKFQFYKRFISVKSGQRSAHQYIDLGTERNDNKNHWVNAFPNTPTLKDNYIKYETLQQDMQDVARMVGSGEEFYPGGATFLNGTSWRVRYEMADGRVSYWAVYGVNSIGDIKSSDTVSFQDNEDNVVSSDAVDYQNSWQTDPNNYNPDTINNSLLSRLRQSLNDIQSLPADMNTVANEGSPFANFLQKVWQKFPEIYIIFIGGLIIAIILRILGR